MIKINTASADCLNESMLRRLACGDCTPTELIRCEEHVNSCSQCAELLESRAVDDDWRRNLSPAFQSRAAHDDCTEALPPRDSAAIEASLKLLGPTDDPHMLGRIGSYEVIGLIGGGGMGVVFKAFDAALNRFVAIKMMQPHLAVSGAARQRFEREGRAAAAVINDCVLPIHAVAEWQGVPYLVMQYSPGMNLQRRLETQGPLRLPEILRVALQTSRGLAAAHSQGLVHRDVKPSNILLDGSVERTLLTDFGLARAVDDASVTRTGLIAGTPQYMSPEQVRGEKVDARSDLFSLGATMYAMCTGRSPFRGESTYTVLHRLTHEQPRPIREINPEIPTWLCTIIDRLLAKQPSDRYQRADELGTLLQQCLAHVQQPATVELPVELQPNPANRGGFNGWKWTIAAAMLGGFIALGIVILLETNKGTLRIESQVDNVPIRITQGNEVVKDMIVSKDGASVRIAAGSYVIKLQAMNGEDLVIEDGNVSLRCREVEVVKIVEQSNDQSILGHGDGSAALLYLPVACTGRMACANCHSENPPSWSIPLRACTGSKSCVDCHNDYSDRLSSRSLIEEPLGLRKQKAQVRSLQLKLEQAEKNLADGTATQEQVNQIRLELKAATSALEAALQIESLRYSIEEAVEEQTVDASSENQLLQRSTQSGETSAGTRDAVEGSLPIQESSLSQNATALLHNGEFIGTIWETLGETDSSAEVSDDPNAPFVSMGFPSEPGGVPTKNIAYQRVKNATITLFCVTPIPNTRSSYQFEEIESFTTDSSGRFKIVVPEKLRQYIVMPTPDPNWKGLLMITITAPGLAIESKQVLANSNFSFVPLIRGDSIHGRLLDETDKPVAGARVTLNDLSRASESEMNDWLAQTSNEPLLKIEIDPADTKAILKSREHARIALHSVGWVPQLIEGVVTDSNGRFTIDGIGANDIVNLNVEAIGYRSMTIKAIGRGAKTAYALDPFGSGENVAIHGRDFEANLVTEDQSETARLRVIRKP